MDRAVASGAACGGSIPLRRILFLPFFIILWLKTNYEKWGCNACKSSVFPWFTGIFCCLFLSLLIHQITLIFTIFYCFSLIFMGQICGQNLVICGVPLFKYMWHSSTKYAILYLLPNLQQKGGECLMAELSITFLVSVLAGVVSHYICKWLDRDK